MDLDLLETSMILIVKQNEEGIVIEAHAHKIFEIMLLTE